MCMDCPELKRLGMFRKHYATWCNNDFNLAKVGVVGSNPIARSNFPDSMRKRGPKSPLPESGLVDPRRATDCGGTCAAYRSASSRAAAS